MNIPRLLENRDSVYGVLALWIILFHTFRRISMPFVPVITNLISIGNFVVDVFMFYSGVCLALSAARNKYEETGWKEFYKRRIARVIIPYLVICVPFYLWAAFCEHSGSLASSIAVFLANISSATFWLKGTTTTWFVYGIMLCYLLFPHIYLFAKKRSIKEQLIFIIGLVLFSVAISYIPVLKYGRLAWLRLPIFSLGVMTGVRYLYNSNTPSPLHVTNRDACLILSTIIFAILGGITSSNELHLLRLPFAVRIIMYLPMTIAFAYLISEMDIINKILKNRFLSLMGLISLELYLVHVPLLHPLKQYGVIKAVGYWLYLVLPVASIAISAAAYGIEQHILKRGLLK